MSVSTSSTSGGHVPPGRRNPTVVERVETTHRNPTVVELVETTLRMRSRLRSTSVGPRPARSGGRPPELEGRHAGRVEAEHLPVERQLGLAARRRSSRPAGSRATPLRTRRYACGIPLATSASGTAPPATAARSGRPGPAAAAPGTTARRRWSAARADSYSAARLGQRADQPVEVAGLEVVRRPPRTRPARRRRSTRLPQANTSVLVSAASTVQPPAEPPSIASRVRSASPASASPRTAATRVLDVDDRPTARAAAPGTPGRTRWSRRSSRRPRRCRGW